MQWRQLGDLGAPGTETLSTYPFVTPFAADFGGDDFAAEWPATAFKAGGSVRIRFRFSAGAAPSPEAGVWLDDLSLRCAQAVGEASAYAFLEGTSMAAPHVSGAAALLFSLRPAASVTAVREALLEGVDPVASLGGKTVTGGRLDAAAALESLEPTLPPAPAAAVLLATDLASPATRTSR